MHVVFDIVEENDFWTRMGRVVRKNDSVPPSHELSLKSLSERSLFHYQLL